MPEQVSISTTECVACGGTIGLTEGAAVGLTAMPDSDVGEINGILCDEHAEQIRGILEGSADV